MQKKILPFTKEFIEDLARKYPTPFYVYDEHAIRTTLKRLYAAFAWCGGFKEYFAVKATPNPHLLKLIKSEGAGTDCSSLPELILSEKAGILGEDIMFTSNNTPAAEFKKAKELGAIINLDDITHISFLEECAGLSELICFRYNPGSLYTKDKGENTSIIGKPEEAKYGLTREQVFKAYGIVKEKGCNRFGLHTMVASNQLDKEAFRLTAQILFDLAIEIQKRVGVRLEFINLGGGFGIPYRLEAEPLDLEYIGREIEKEYQKTIVPNGLHPLRIFVESGRLITGPAGYLVTRAIHEKNIYKKYIGVDACMANLMRPALYGAYHHITVLGKEDAPATEMVDVVGSLCENNDKFAVDRKLPKIDMGDLLVLHDAGAHGYAMGFQYNGKLRCAELLLREDNTVVMIRRAETVDDYFATLDFDKNIF